MLTHYHQLRISNHVFCVKYSNFFLKKGVLNLKLGKLSVWDLIVMLPILTAH